MRRLLFFVLPVVAAFACGGSSTSAPAPASTDDAGTIDSSSPDAGSACAAPTTSCGGKCVDTAKDVANCGTCGKACKVGELCRSSACEVSLGYAARKIFLGDTDRSFATSSNAWKAYGRDIDGIASTATANGECKPVAGASASSRVDGDSGLDNAWGKSIMPIFQAFASDFSKQASMLIEGGNRTPMIVFGAHTGKVSPFPAGFVFAEKGLLPAWLGTDLRQVAEAWATSAGTPKSIFPIASVTGDQFASGDITTPILLDLSFGQAPLRLPIAKAQITMTMSADGVTASAGNVSGVVATQDLVDAFTKAAGYISTSLCGGSTVDSINQSIRQASDILKDGTQDPNKDCDGISIGVGFEAVAVTVGDVALPDSPQPDPCK